MRVIDARLDCFTVEVAVWKSVDGPHREATLFEPRAESHDSFRFCQQITRALCGKPKTDAKRLLRLSGVSTDQFAYAYCVLIEHGFRPSECFTRVDVRAVSEFGDRFHRSCRRSLPLCHGSCNDWAHAHVHRVLHRTFECDRTRGTCCVGAAGDAFARQRGSLRCVAVRTRARQVLATT